ncbi:unnamed protein product [Wickerhamomyces anomalus]
MKFIQALSISALITTALAIDNVVKLPVTKTKTNKLSKAVHSGLVKRAQDHQESLADDGVGYFATIEVGSPAQTIRVQIDTGSSDLWFPGTNNPQCPQGTATPIDQGSPYQDDFDYCLRSAQYDPGASSSWKVDSSAPAFHIEYVDYSFATGSWDESSNEGSDAFQYPNFPQRLKSDGYISKIVYSLYPSEDPYTTSGDIDITLLFGGVDTAKYSGTLEVFPLDSNYDLAITLTGISTDISGQTSVASTQSLSAVLDSGTTLQALPYNIVEQLAYNLGGSGETDSYGYFIVPCNYGSDDHITYTFGTKNINVPVEAVVSSDGNGNCALAIEPTNGLTILGDTFLINAYVVYDLEDREIAIAQAKYTSTENIQPVISSIPGAVRAAAVAAPSVAASATGGFVTSIIDSSATSFSMRIVLSISLKVDLFSCVPFNAFIFAFEDSFLILCIVLIRAGKSVLLFIDTYFILDIILSQDVAGIRGDIK